MDGVPIVAQQKGTQLCKMHKELVTETTSAMCFPEGMLPNFYQIDNFHIIPTVPESSEIEAITKKMQSVPMKYRKASHLFQKQDATLHLPFIHGLQNHFLSIYYVLRYYARTKPRSVQRGF